MLGALLGGRKSVRSITGAVGRAANSRTRTQRAGHRTEAALTKAVSYTHIRAHETVLDLVCRLLPEKKKQTQHSKADTRSRYAIAELTAEREQSRSGM